MRIMLFFLISMAATFSGALAQDRMDFWEGEPRHGANSFNDAPPSQAYFDALAAYGADWVRLSWTKWDSTGQGAFLIGDPGNYEGLVPEDLAILRETVARAERSGLAIVLTPLSLPGAVWQQHNDDTIDDRLYTDKTYWDQSAAFWQDMARAFRDQPGIVAYNLLNEPTPERPAGFEGGEDNADRIAWYQEQRGSARDLPALSAFLVAAIRAEDAGTPVMVDGGFFAGPAGFAYFPGALPDERVLYAFHMYEPWAATSAWNVRNGSKLVYPGAITAWGETEYWDAARVEQTMQQPLDWAGRHGIARNRMVLAEFGCMRRLDWCPDYLEDVLGAADADGLHWAFYSFREDSWDGMDYELGGGAVGAGYWQAADEGTLDDWPRGPTPQFEPIRRRLAGETGPE